jgi:large subunit ribosomal protein L10
LAISRVQKEKMVADYVDRMSRSRVLILTDYRGLSVADISELRQRLREVDSVFQVVKNTLFTRALKETGLPIPSEHLQGTVGVGYCLGDAPPVAKALMDFAKEREFLRVRGAILSTSVLDADGVKIMADLPPREVVLAQLLGVVQGPMSSLVSTIQAPMRELVQVLRARSEQGQEAAA